MPVMAYTPEEARTHAARQHRHTNTLVQLRAQELARKYGITEAAAWSRALRDPQLLRMYTLWRDPHEAAVRLSALTAEQETQAIVDGINARNEPEIVKKVKALAVEIAQEHDISVDDAIPHVLRRNPELSVEWFEWFVDGKSDNETATDNTAKMSEPRTPWQKIEAEARALMATAGDALTFADATTRVMDTRPDLAAAYARERR